ncbi:hypothetical protein CUC00_12430 [Prevotella intermedia]|uniref:hypothetical protein n=1 Tax=Prevotella intermedia TaxID=28131 RepID=UPI0005EAEDC2|nr:hypothetical protein [Prevotella intermedia]ATV34405.1 hypothetical protein CTM44_11560 [Prevotella intermedia]ATV41864.1 hypothetical protein CUC00_12430 [Prevotella intermedia]
MRIYFEGIRDTETRAYLFAEVPSGAVIPDGKNDIIKRDRSGIFDCTFQIEVQQTATFFMVSNL